MPSDDDEIIIRNGTPWNWLTYTIVFGGKAPEAYEGGALVGGKRIKAYWVVAALVTFAIIGWWV